MKEIRNIVIEIIKNNSKNNNILRLKKICKKNDKSNFFKNNMT